MDIDNYAAIYREKLLGDVIPFWIEHSLDRECGGYLTCLDREGKVYDTDKFMWLQGREVWMLARIYLSERSEEQARSEPSEQVKGAKCGSYLDAARLGAEFIRDHGFDEHGRIYFALDRAGKPIEQPNSIFSDFFCAMGLVAYGVAADEQWARTLGSEMGERIQQWLVERRSPWDTSIAEARAMTAMAHDMINVNFCQEMHELLAGEQWAEAGIASMEKIVRLHIDAGEGLIFENVAPDGTHPDTFAGRLILPGHALECAWILIDASKRWDRPDIAAAAVAAVIPMLEFGWDDEYGGLFYFMDAHGKPPQQLDCDRKLWWVHGETLVALLLGYQQTHRSEFAEWFEKVHEYTWNHFDDPECGEWFGYLDREGKPYLTLKGGKWKGCFHTPRSLWMCRRILKELKEEPPGGDESSLDAN